MLELSIEEILAYNILSRKYETKDFIVVDAYSYQSYIHQESNKLNHKIFHNNKNIWLDIIPPLPYEEIKSYRNFSHGYSPETHKRLLKELELN
jgi:hypothetical protein